MARLSMHGSPSKLSAKMRTKRQIPNSPSPTTPLRSSIPKRIKSDNREDDSVSLQDIYNLITDMKTEMATKHAELDKRIEGVEEKIKSEIQSLKSSVKTMVTEEVKKRQRRR
ncbi:hypothetical protein OS493_001554 [Desmophyllum pertusum]|uniref:Uncharacterized protein n=1 Tax=Desmophyllum pertusum TaxID=174260 RepID=A0A9X0D1H5_9CNID|nr:hypothetical protein OS493_001554 [Desmophyllum pertusum]